MTNQSRRQFLKTGALFGAASAAAAVSAPAFSTLSLIHISEPTRPY